MQYLDRMLFKRPMNTSMNTTDIFVKLEAEPDNPSDKHAIAVHVIVIFKL